MYHGKCKVRAPSVLHYYHTTITLLLHYFWQNQKAWALRRPQWATACHNERASNLVGSGGAARFPTARDVPPSVLLGGCIQQRARDPQFWNFRSENGRRVGYSRFHTKWWKKWPKLQADMLMGLVLSAVLIQCFCGFRVVHISRSIFHISFCSPRPVLYRPFERHNFQVYQRQWEFIIHLCFAERALNTMFWQIQDGP